jgi:hypothetical protein
MGKNKFWLGGRLFNTASPRLAAPMQHKERPQDGRPNATQGLSASWAPTQRKARPQVACPNVRLQLNARHVRKLGAPTQLKARPQVGHPNARPRRKRKARPHVRRLGAPTQRKACPQVGRPNATQGEFARWAPKRKTHPQRKRPQREH